MTSQKQLFFFLFTCFCIQCYAQEKPNVSGNLPNIISVIPFQFTENGLGFGASYERIVDKKGMIAVYIPVMATFNVANSNRIYDYNTGNYSTGKADAMYYAMPGIKFYPTGSHGIIKYAVGLSAVVANGKMSTDLTNLHGLNVTEKVSPHFIAGGMLQNSVNVNTGKNVYMGAEVGVGSSFVNRSGNSDLGNKFLIQGGLKVGYRF